MRSLRSIVPSLILLGAVAAATPAAASGPGAWRQYVAGKLRTWGGKAVARAGLHLGPERYNRFGFQYAVKPYFTDVNSYMARSSRLSAREIFHSATWGYSGIVELTLERHHDAVPAELAGMRYLHVPMMDNHDGFVPEREQRRLGLDRYDYVKGVLDFASRAKREGWRFIVHCQAGQGRTGMMVAAVRIALDGLTAEQAIAEGRMHGLKLPEQIAFIRQFARDLEAGKIEGYGPHS